VHGSLTGESGKAIMQSYKGVRPYYELNYS